MIEEIKQIIADNSEEKHFVEYGKGVFATQDAVDEIAESVVKLFSIHNVSKSVAKQYAEFCVRCDREGLPLLELDDYIKQYCC